MKWIMTNKQKDLIDCMNEFCKEYFKYDENTTCQEASAYIDRNIEEYKLAIMSDWQYQYM